jgi:hypothetical protein
MKSKSMLAAVFSFFAMACGGSQEGNWETDPLDTQEAALSGPIIGTWCRWDWPGCFTINADGNGFMINNGDSCWRAGDQVFSGLVTGGAPSTYLGTRLMYGTGVCTPAAAQSDTLTMNGTLSFMEVTSGGYRASWYRAAP